MKKLFIGICLLLTTVAANAQFEKGTFMVNASMTNGGIAYSTNEKMTLGLEATAGYFLLDNFGLVANVGMNITNTVNTFQFGMGGRFYFNDCGLFLQGGLQATDYNYKKETGSDETDFGLTSEFGYTFFVSHTIAIEPAGFYNLSFKDGDYSKFGAKIGISIYF